MADSGGHWATLAECEKLTQSELLAGVVDEDPKRGNLLPLLPVRQAMGISIKWNRSNARRTATRVSVGSQLTWSDNVTYTEVESKLSIFTDQTPLNKFVRDVYGTINNYAAQQMLELRVGLMETQEDAVVYDDVDYNALHIRGLHHWAVDSTGTDLDIDEGEGPLSVMNMRVVVDAMRNGVDFILMPFCIRRQLSAFYQEAGRTAPSLMGSFMWAPNQAGIPIAFWDGIPIVCSDYLVAEQANTGVGANTRAKRTSGTNMYSVFFIKKGAPAMLTQDPGLILAFGGDTNQSGEFFRPEYFEKLEGYDAAGVRLTSYIGMLAGSKFAIGRIYDITNTPVIA